MAKAINTAAYVSFSAQGGEAGSEGASALGFSGSRSYSTMEEAVARAEQIGATHVDGHRRTETGMAHDIVWVAPGHEVVPGYAFPRPIPRPTTKYVVEDIGPTRATIVRVHGGESDAAGPRHVYVLAAGLDEVEPGERVWVDSGAKKIVGRA